MPTSQPHLSTAVASTSSSGPVSAADRDQARRFLRRLTIATGGGMFIDGFVFASVAAALAGKAMTSQLGITSVWASLISSSTLIGTFVGGLCIGYLTDRIGRRRMFTIDLIAFLIFALAMFLVSAPWQLFAIGLFMGVAIGGDYSIGSPLLAEFAPSVKRGNYLGVLEILWNVGYVIAYLIGYLINTHWPNGWHVILAASAVPAAICLIIRHGLPESPRWLLSKGRRDEAITILHTALGETADLSDFHAEQEEATSYGILFDRDYRQRTIFVCTFWICIVLPYFAIVFFQPTVLGDLGLGSNALLGALFGTCVALVGAVTGWFLVDRVGRRKILIAPMFLCAACLFIVSLDHSLPAGVAVVSFFGYLYFYGIMSILPGIYPDEVFPTSVRTSGVGLASAASRMGAAAGTFLLPLSLHHLGLSWSMTFMGAVSLIGGITSFAWAPETNGQHLSAAGARTAGPSLRATAGAR
jgi:putative MFS transporter